MNRLAQSQLDFDLDMQSGSNTWIALLLAAIIIAMLLVFVAFDQQSKWWFGTVVNDLYTNSGYQVYVDGAGDFIYLVAAGCLAAVVIGFNLLRSPKFIESSINALDEKHNLATGNNHIDKRMMAHFNRYDEQGQCITETEVVETHHHNKKAQVEWELAEKDFGHWQMFQSMNPCLRNILNPSGHGQQGVFIYLDSNIDDIHVDLQRDIHGYFAHHGKSLRLLAPPQVLSGQSVLSLESQVSRIHKHVVSQHIDSNSQILVIGDGDMADMVSTVCRRYQRDVKLVQIPYH